MTSPNSSVPHQAIMWLHAEVHELLPTGECSGVSVHTIPQAPLVFNAENKDETIRKLEAIIMEVKTLCRAM